jgi:hypothetical protein
MMGLWSRMSWGGEEGADESTPMVGAAFAGGDGGVVGPLSGPDGSKDGAFPNASGGGVGQRPPPGAAFVRGGC